ncbi:toprim domain-containing protein [Candidatus Dojkabacteria bacterium]|jgi:DNA gyrase/topoisomerase IV subunit B|nr:toprim domain-containing protein [Candidatus Dojkabacteria bacterium]
MAKDKTYTGADIVSLTDKMHVRMRTQIYLGSMSPTTYTIPLLSEDTLKMEEVIFIPSVFKAVGEILDNSLDEFSQITSKVKLLKINASPETGLYTISDNGRGIPIEKKIEIVGKTKKEIWTPEIALSHLRAGRNFTDDKEVGVVGSNGVGSSCVNFCSTDFEVVIQRDHKKYYQKFSDGAEKISKPVITDTTSKTTGTELTFQLDPIVFKDVSLPDSLIRNRAIEIALMNPDVTVEYNSEKFRFKKGLQEYIDKIAKDKITYKMEVNEANVQGEIYIVCDGHEGLDEVAFTWINSSYLFDGGKCNTQIFNLIFDRVGTHLEREAKKLKAEVTRNDIRKGLLVFANLKIKNPEFDSQSKTRMVGPDLRKELTNVVDSNWKAFAKTTSGWLANILERANERYHYGENKKAIEDHEKHIKKKIKVEGLLDATSKNRFECQLLVTEGLSAKAQISEARDPKTCAAFALTGKINNVYGCSAAQVLKMGKLTDLLSVIGLTPGKRADRSAMRYSKVVIATDADQDGANICTLLLNLFYQFWPCLFDKNYEPVFYRLMAPNIVASKGSKRVHFTTKADYEKVKDKYKGWTIEFMKGLGGMGKDDFTTILSGDDCLIPFIDDGHMKEVFELLFGDNTDSRKNWLTVDD